MSPPLLLGFTVPDDLMDVLLKADSTPPIQTHKFAWALARSLKAGFGDVRLFSAAPVQSFPHVRRLVFRKRAFRQDGVDGRCMGFVNLIGLKHVTRFLACLAATPRLLREGTDTVFVHGVHTPFLAYGWLLSFLGVRFLPVVTDPPGVVLPTDGRLARALKALDRRIAALFIGRAHGLVTLSPAIAELFPHRRTLVFPGILNADWLATLARQPAPAERDGPLTVVYAGGLSRAYGVHHLLAAAESLPDVRFVIFGKGELAGEIGAARAPNLTYGGFVDAQALAPHLLGADILINPRPSDQDFARYSFPSKLIEYGATGRAVLTTRIASLPAELKDVFFFIEDESSNGIVEAIRRLASMAPEARLAQAERARAVILRAWSEAGIGHRLAAFAAGSEAADAVPPGGAPEDAGVGGR